MPGNGRLWGFTVSEGGLEHGFRCDFPGSGKSCNKGNTTGANAPGYSAKCSLSGPPPGLCMAGRQVRGASAPAPLPAPRYCRRQRQQRPAGAQQLGCAGRSGLPSVMSGATHTLKRLSFGTSWRTTKMVVQGARERMFCHVAPIRLPCSRSSACCPVDLICRIAGVVCSDIYAPTGILIRGAVGSTYLSGISARRCYGSPDDPGPADYALRCHQVQVARVASISASSRGSLEAVDDMLDESEFVNAIGAFGRHR